MVFGARAERPRPPRPEPRRSAPSPRPARSLMKTGAEPKDPYVARYLTYLVLGLGLVFGIQALVVPPAAPRPSEPAVPPRVEEAEPWVFERNHLFKADRIDRARRMARVEELFRAALLRSDGGELSEDEAALVVETGAALSALGAEALQDYFVLMRNERLNPRTGEAPLRVLETLPLEHECDLLWRCLGFGGELGLRAEERLWSLRDEGFVAARLEARPMTAAGRAFLVRAQRDLALPFEDFMKGAGERRIALSIFVEAASEELPDEAAAELSRRLSDEGLRRDALWVLSHSRRPLFLSRLQEMAAAEQDDALFADLCRVLGAYRVVSSAPVLLAAYDGAGSFRRLAVEQALGAIAVQKPSDESWPAWWRRVEPTWAELDARLGALESKETGVAERLALLAQVEELRDPAVARSAAGLLGADDPRLQEAAARVLGSLALPMAERELCALLDSDRPRLRGLAHRALRAMTGLEIGPDRGRWEKEVIGESR